MTTPEWIKTFPIAEMRPELAREWDRLVALHPEQAERYLAKIDRERGLEAEPDETGRDRRDRRQSVLGILLGIVIGIVLLAALALASAS